MGYLQAKWWATAQGQRDVQYVRQLREMQDCRMNWIASSRSMEPDVVVELVKGAISTSAQVSVMVGDEDSATIKKVRESVTHEVDKWSDITRAQRAFGPHLYSLQPQHKGILTTKVINHFLKCPQYALSRNKDNVDGVRIVLMAKQLKLIRKQSILHLKTHLHENHSIRLNKNVCSVYKYYYQKRYCSCFQKTD